MTEAAGDTQRGARHDLRRRLLLTGLLLIAVVVTGAVIDGLRLRNSLESGKSQLDQLTLDDIRDQGLDSILSDVAADFGHASSIADTSPFLAAFVPVPVLGDQVDALRDLTAAAQTLGNDAEETGRRVSVALDDAGRRPAGRVELLEVVSAELTRIERVADRIDVGADGALLPPVADAKRSLVDALAEVPERLEPVRGQVAALRDLLAGPSSYLVLVGNNAEMRAGAAMPLQIGTAEIDNGDIELSEFYAATSDFSATEATGAFNGEIDEELRATYPRWNIGFDFPETAVIPDFTRAGPIQRDYAFDARGWMTEGVIHIDAMALAALLEVVGPIEVDGVEYTSETAPQLVLNQTYLDYAGVPRALRRDAQSDLAQRLFDAIEERDVDLLDVVGALQHAAEGRHVMAWSQDDALQELFGSLAIDGAVGPFDTLVSVQNTAANKLDWYLDAEVDVSAVRADDEHWRVTMSTTVIHPDRELTVPYIEGPKFDDGTHRMLVTAQLPSQATELSMPGSEVTEFGFDGTSNVIGTRFDLPRGQRRTVTTTYLLPRAHGGIRVLPSARVRPVPWSVNGIDFDDDVPTAIGFGAFPSTPRDDGWIPIAMAGVMTAVAGVVVLARSARRAGARGAMVDDLTGAFLLTAGFVVVVLAGFVF